jgi:hypothetical protein
VRGKINKVPPHPDPLPRGERENVSDKEKEEKPHETETIDP